MKWLSIALVAALWIFASACGGSEENTDAANHGSENQGRLAGGGELTYQGTTIGRCQTVPATQLDETSDAGLQIACDDADATGFDMEPHSAKTLDDTGRQATVRVTGYSESCEYDCPGEIYADVKMFRDTNGSWSISAHELIELHWNKTDERIEAERAAVKDSLDKQNCVVAPKSVDVSGGSFRASITQIGQPPDYSVELLVDLPAFSGVVFYSRLSSGGTVFGLSPFTPNDVLGSTLDFNIQGSGQIRACRFIDFSHGMVRGEWQTQ